MKVLYMIEFTEYERGWGSKHISTSFHTTQKGAEDEREECVGDRSGPVPDYYINESPIKAVPVTDELFAKVQETEKTAPAFFDPKDIFNTKEGVFDFKFK